LINFIFHFENIFIFICLFINFLRNLYNKNIYFFVHQKQIFIYYQMSLIFWNLKYYSYQNFLRYPYFFILIIIFSPLFSPKTVLVLTNIVYYAETFLDFVLYFFVWDDIFPYFYHSPIKSLNFYGTFPIICSLSLSIW
jgi:hypothetical protein